MKEKTKNICEKIDKNIGTEYVLEKFSKWLDHNKKIAFLLTLIAGIITHITMLTSTIMSQDGLWLSMKYNRAGDFEMTLGRWGIEILQRLYSFIAIPTISTTLCILIMAISAMFLVDLFDFKSKFSIIFTALILAVQPSLTVTLLYVYTAVPYCMAFLISVLVIWFIYKCKLKKVGLVISTLLFAFSLSIYQSYIGVSIGLCLIITIIDLIKSEKNVKEIFINLVKTVAIVIIGGLIYYVITSILLKINNLNLAEYKDINAFSIKDILFNLGITIPNCYKDFFNFFIKDSIIFNTNYNRNIAYILEFAMLAILSIASIASIKGENKTLRIICAIIFILLLPISLNVIDILVKENVMYALTSAQMILMIPFMFAIMEQANHLEIVKWISILLCFFIIGTYYIADNASYADMKMRFNQAEAVSIRIMDRLETTPGYKKEYPICIIGIIGDNNYPKVGNLYQFSLGSVFMNPVFHGSYDGSIETMDQFLKVFLGEDVTFCTSEEYEKIVRSDEVKELSDFPEENCTTIIDNVVVIKLSNYIPLPNGTLLYEEY